ncbi:ephexin-1-like isoform X2 [Branchiostoma floridae]|nr:ephexin-1-like isoform X1 [Branchiostoma floridae]XP_035697389.1 ephexin-1-like isoform X2 [Branchiostoma floridae]
MDFDEVPTLQQPNLQEPSGYDYETPMFPGGEMPAFLTPINQRVEPAHTESSGADLSVDYVSRSKNRQSRFFHEPLYQVYRAQNSARSIRSNRSDAITEEDIEEEDGDDYEDVVSMSASEASLKRTMWKDLPEVRTSGFLNSLSSAELKLQEALFEVVTSEASYLRSLNILVDHFMPGLIRPLSRTERTHLFSNCKEVRDQSERLLLAMEGQLQKDIRLSKVPDLVLNHARSYFEEYIKYCRNLVYQERVLRRLTTENTGFHSMLQKLEVDRMCAGLDLQSFLILPMQRIARMPLLFDAIIQRAEVGTSLYNSAYRAYKFLSKTLKACNEEARIMAKTEEMVLLQKQLTFKPGVKEIAVVSGKRYLVKKGELTQITQEKKKYLRQPLHMFLFTDLLLVTKKKSDLQYTIIDYAERSFVEAKEKEDPDFALSATKLTATQKLRRFTGTLTIPPIESLFTMELFENHEGKHVMIDLASTLSERTRWVEAIMPPKSDVSGETIYEEWDCPQVQVIHPYQAQQPDELELERSDIINVSRKMADGWYEGERIRDGEKGWFPSSYTEEIENSHARARNLKYRHRRQLSLGEA